jgi:hypothetical protein
MRAIARVASWRENKPRSPKVAPGLLGRVTNVITADRAAATPDEPAKLAELRQNHQELQPFRSD